MSVVFIDWICYAFTNVLVDTFKLQSAEVNTPASYNHCEHCSCTHPTNFFHAKPKLLLGQAHSSSVEPKFSSLGILGIPISTFQGLNEGVFKLFKLVNQ